jgi:hypothetical protein
MTRAMRGFCAACCALPAKGSNAVANKATSAATVLLPAVI